MKFTSIEWCQFQWAIVDQYMYMYRKCPSFREAPRSALSTSMTEENCSYFKNMRNTHLLDEHNNLPGCEIELS